mmetsp:Transcript_7452/g.10821  ORF Transcript_7452/g.10821 Transcript_7452/m.10821 type:complete len:671 (-) Transcript_7452:76-2088(-)|eukprot:CAMPEP_0172429134 /NCGR_PEP_ID=MMETSP1064-20121228/49214_1 /TAXON_ID=202472 /ORGANISM="Aulacoseira subarctica , Strain CCAP 1002/5" /LENGTH=670 /DNA_ID=CAMNT_0013174337 /DNA_START=154 /DNA_END=2166 /DNA_ORIENTATION=-
MVAKKPGDYTKESPNRCKNDVDRNKIDSWFNAKHVLSSLLFKAIEEGNWSGATDIALNAPEEASKWATKLEGDGEIAWRRLPLHEVCVRQPSYEFVMTLLSCNRDASMLPDHNGRLPLHLACCHGASLKIIQALLMEYPEAVLIKDKWGKTPLCNASACTVFLPEEKEEILDALDQEPLYWHIEYERKLWNEEEAVRAATLEQIFEKERLRYSEKISRLLKQSKDEREDFISTKKMYEETINRLTQDIGSMKKASPRSVTSSLSSDLNLEEYVNALEMELTLLRLEFDSDRAPSNNNVSQSTVASLQKQLDSALEKNLALETEVANSANEAAKLAAEVEQIVASEAELKAYSDELFAELEEALSNNNELEKTIQAMETERTQLKHELVVKTVQLQEQTEGKSTPSRGESSESPQRTPNSSSRVFNFNARVLEVKLQDEQEYNTQLKRELTKVRSDVTRLEAALHTSESKTKDLEQQVTELTRKLEECMTTISKLEDDANNTYSKADALENQLSISIDKHGASIDNSSSTEIEILTTKLAGANIHNSTLKKVVEELKQKCESLEGKLRAANGGVEQQDDTSLLVSSLSQSAQFANNRTRKIAKMFEEKLVNAMVTSNQASSRHKQEKEKLYAKINKLEETVRQLTAQQQTIELSSATNTFTRTRGNANKQR